MAGCFGWDISFGEMTEEESEREDGQRWLVVAAHVQGGGAGWGRGDESDNEAVSEIAPALCPGVRLPSFVFRRSSLSAQVHRSSLSTFNPSTPSAL